MAAIRLTPTWRPSPPISSSQTTLISVKIKCMRFNSRFVGDIERRPPVVAKAAMTVNGTSTSKGVDVVTIVRTAVVRRSVVQLFIEKVLIDCRFFTMFAVAGTLLGSVLCFLEGTCLVMESYIQYIHSDQGQIMQLLIESLDMFLVGTAMLVFGMGLHVMFVGSQSQLSSSNLFGMFNLKKIPRWAGMKSVTQAKSMIGYALMLLLQVGVLEKFKSIPLATGIDLACFAGAVFVSSAGLFILSKLNLDT